MELSIALITGALLTLVASAYNIPPLLLIASYPACFIVGYVVGQWHKHHES